MPQIRVALAQVPHSVGDLDGNAAAVLRATATAAAGGAHLVAFPEMMLTGYPPEDLVLRPSVRAASVRALHALAADLDTAGLGDIAVIVGYLDDHDGARNAAAFLLGGTVITTYFKHHLPNYGVFDERRYFTPGDRLPVVGYRGLDVAMTICEDAWQAGGPFAAARTAGVDLVVNINGSPYERGKDDVRLELIRRRAAEADAPVVYVNAVCGQDELVFDGTSFAVSATGELLHRSPQFVEDIGFLDLDLPGASVRAPADVVTAGTADAMTIAGVDTGTGPVEPYPPLPARLAAEPGDLEQVWNALVLGVRDYVVKNGFRSVVLGMSGGIDSAVVAALAADAIGGAAVYGVSMPSDYSSEHSRTDAADLADRLRANYREAPIGALTSAFVTSLQLTGLAEENVQARVRGTTLMALSNSEGHLVLATGNKSELAVGYSTIYGDAVGGYAPLKDVPKTLVWDLARWRNEHARTSGALEPIPANSITKPPSAELRPGQLDSDSLPDYELLDAILARYVDADEGVETIVAAGFDAEIVNRVARMVDTAEWKRRQYPPGPKISFKAFGRDRRLPITNSWREHA